MSSIRKDAEKRPRSSGTARKQEPLSARVEKSGAMSPVPVEAAGNIKIAVEEGGKSDKSDP